ncbi:tautomerase family protein [Paraburkholderia unamae]|uniref:Tautomerase-like protein n=1 Tax=Paraburkholderia unamae TaxID=219649 RepID=A0ABX5KNH2_9BURK|nr:tautomerase family protein [Paraburkholderia unamae]PVX81845.1 tautomerase-like protein [Paraburkholderia unamae]
MPLLRFDILKGHSETYIRNMLDAAHRAVLKAFAVPERDRYQIVHEHDIGRMVVEDTGLGIVRSQNVVVITVVSRPRSEDARRLFYEAVCSELKAACEIRPEDVVVSFIINSDADWSFGNGRAQFLTGEL